MFCTNCGSELNNGSNYCHSCGTEVFKLNTRKEAKKGKDNDRYVIKPTEADPSNTLGLNENKAIIEKPKIDEFYAVPDWKFITLSIATFGLYELFWFGRNWTMVQKQEDSKISPFWRSIFGIFFFNDLAKKILKVAKWNKYNNTYDSFILAIFYFIISMLWKLPDNWWLLSLLTFLPFLPLLKAIRFINETGKKPTNYTVTTGEVIALTIGFIMWFLIILGMLLEFSEGMYY